MARRRITIVTFGLLLVASGMCDRAAAAILSFSNASSIPIPDQSTATPYPSEISVSGVTAVNDITVTLHQLEHEHIADVAVLLVAPTGQEVHLISCNWSADTPEGGVTLTFQHGAPPASFVGLVTSGTWGPNPVCPANSFVFPAPAPSPPWDFDLSLVRTGDPNGTWKLFVFDRGASHQGVIQGGWSLTVDGEGDGGGGGGGGCSATVLAQGKKKGDPDPGCDWLVRFAVVQDGVQTKPRLGSDSNVIHTTTMFNGTMRFTKKPKPRKRMIGTVESFSFTQIDELLAPDLTTTIEERHAFRVFEDVSQNTLKIGANTRLTLAFALESPASERCFNQIGIVLQQSESRLRDGVRFVAPGKRCPLERTFINGPGENEFVSVVITDPEPVEVPPQ